MEILVNLSNRHIHLSEEDFKILFGGTSTLTLFKELRQPGQFAAEEKVNIRIGEKELTVRIIGPFRPETQCEISFTDARVLKIGDIPVRESGQLEDSLPFTIIGPAGEVAKDRGLIAAHRHIHLNPDTAKEYHLENGKIVSLKAGTPKRIVTFHNVIIRVNENYLPECHLDFDEGNAAGIKNGDNATITK